MINFNQTFPISPVEHQTRRSRRLSYLHFAHKKAGQTVRCPALGLLLHNFVIREGKPRQFDGDRGSNYILIRESDNLYIRGFVIFHLSFLLNIWFRPRGRAIKNTFRWYVYTLTHSIITYLLYKSKGIFAFFQNYFKFLANTGIKPALLT